MTASRVGRRAPGTTRLLLAAVEHAVRRAVLLVHPPDDAPEVVDHLLEVGHHERVTAVRQGLVEPAVGPQCVQEVDPGLPDHLREHRSARLPDHHDGRESVRGRPHQLGRGMQVMGDAHRSRLRDLERVDRERAGRPGVPVDHDFGVPVEDPGAGAGILAARERQVEPRMLGRHRAQPEACSPGATRRAGVATAVPQQPGLFDGAHRAPVSRRRCPRAGHSRRSGPS